MAKVIMVQGTMSNVGKSLLVAGLCRIFKQDGYRAVPFKSQNMALNSYVTKEGLEMGRAQVMQAEAAGISPCVYMNPILLKPTSDQGSQVIVNGRVHSNMKARDYFAFKTSLIPEIVKAVKQLEDMADILVIEGAGSPAEINLKQNDIVNMGMAAMVDAPVLLAGDIDRGGVFAQLLGTLDLLEEDERSRVGGLIINKFRGDKSILEPGIRMIEERCKVPVIGTIPYFKHSLEDEDSLSERFDNKKREIINIGVIKLPRISNFTDFDVFEQFEGVALHYFKNPRETRDFDMVIIPGSKNTIADRKWLTEQGFDGILTEYAKNKPLFGICGGYQMLGEEISDPYNTEAGGSIKGLGLLAIKTVLDKEKQRGLYKGRINDCDGLLKGISGMEVSGYEIHMGKSYGENVRTLCDDKGHFEGNVYGSYIHGFFDNGALALEIVKSLFQLRGLNMSELNAKDRSQIKEEEYNALADIIRNNCHCDSIYNMLKDIRISENI